MGQGIKLIAGGLALFLLGGAVVYFVSQPDAAVTHAATQAQSEPVPAATPTSTNPATEAITTESFYEAAEARREQVLINKEEADRIAKLKAAKERSVECKFWKQQQKTSSAAAKIEAKINEHCNLASSSAASTSSATSDSASTSSVTAE